ncbi:hypothetical protein RFI_02320 [Reticulomyxa filosa]|uniref:CAP-Gly domain-containing protein n=1 Tax=Reticulomyxa filosa TaxID=46433 RepID=X6P9B8_RETFI|nr:hypothetical protein RFI_02320 [Reticulomyxa filosa]|eukprot:ETO34771.1 hypothetical protein RFI_02320 [Reticulomyxa filosa]
MGKRSDTEYEKAEEKPQVVVQHNQRKQRIKKSLISYQKDAIKKKRTLQQLREVNLTNVDKSLQLFLKDPQKEKHDTTIAISGGNAAATAECASRPQHTPREKYLETNRESMTMITGSENVAQLNEQNENDIVTKIHHEQAPSHIFSNEFVSKTALNQIARGYSTIHNCRLADFDLLTFCMCDQIHWENAFNITINGNNYFTAKEGHGLFVTRETIVKRLKNDSHNEEVFFEVGDCDWNYLNLLQMVATEDLENKGTNTEKFLFCFEKNRRGITKKQPEAISEDLEMEPPSNYQSTDRSSVVITEDKNAQDGEFELNRQKIETELVVDVSSIIVLKNGFEELIFFFFFGTHYFIVRYSGIPDFGKGEKFIVVELNERDENAGDGSKNGKRYFSYKTERGLFVKPKDITKVLKVPSNLKYLDLNYLLNEEHDPRTSNRISVEERLRILEEKER